MAVTREEIIEALKEMSLLEASELVRKTLLREGLFLRRKWAWGCGLKSTSRERAARHGTGLALLLMLFRQTCIHRIIDS